MLPKRSRSIRRPDSGRFIVAILLGLCLWLGLSVSPLAFAPLAPGLARALDGPVAVAGASASAARWRLASETVEKGQAMRVYVEAEPQPGHPAFRVETALSVTPGTAATTLMQDMMSAEHLPKGQRRRLLERRDREVIVHTYLELPLMLADRELALRIRHSDDVATGIHRIDFEDVNDRLPEAERGVVRLTGTAGFWEFRPQGADRSDAIYVSRAAVGGSIPALISDRLMRAQAIDAVVRLQQLLRDRAHGRGARPQRSSAASHE